MDQEVINFWVTSAEAHINAQPAFEQYFIQLNQLKWSLRMAEREADLSSYL